MPATMPITMMTTAIGLARAPLDLERWRDFTLVILQPAMFSQ